MRKKLIEVALPLEAINRESMHEKSVPRRGHPATLHLWWARRPLATCRAVLFASIVDDPDQEGVPQALLEQVDRLPLPEDRGPDWAGLALGEQRRKRLFGFIEKLSRWENSNNEAILTAASKLIQAATGDKPPAVLDPFCGGGSIPLEAHRLGLDAHASDLNPVAVLVTKSLIEIAPRFAGCPPVNPTDRSRGLGAPWNGAAGLAADVRSYGQWMRDEAEKRMTRLYPKAKLPNQSAGGETTVIAWLWARTVVCPNPACGAQMPLARSFWLSTKAGKRAWIEPVVDRAARAVRFEVRSGQGMPRDGTVNRRGATCIVCETPVPFDHVRAEGRAGRMGSQLMAIVAEGQRGRVYLPANEEHERVAASAEPTWAPETALPEQALGFRVQLYGMTRHRDLFTPRQLAAMSMFSDLVGEARERARRDAEAAGLPDNAVPLAEGGSGAAAYADAVATYLAFAVSKLADWSSSICSWIHRIEGVRDTFARQAIPMVWDYVEINPLSGSVGNYRNHVEWVADGIAGLPCHEPAGHVRQLDATSALNGVVQPLVATDPPYYDNIGYADLSDFFYVWLRRSLGDIYPTLFSTVLTPKTQELIASPYRFQGSREKAQRFFEEGLGKAFSQMRAAGHPEYPLTVYYAFKQAEADADEEDDNGNLAVASTGWETMLEGLLKAGFAITGTWPMRTERSARSVGIGTNALASSVVLVCRPREENAPLATRRDLLSGLKAELPEALRKLQHGNVAPVDLAQAAIGPGMAVFSRFSKVLDASGNPLSVRTALQLINQVLDEVLVEQESEYDPATRWAVAWFDQFGMNEGLFGDAETLSKAKDVAISGLEEAGILRARAGKVRLLRRDELPADWDPTRDRRITVWEITQHLIRAQQGEGDAGAASLLAKVGSLGEIARDLAYRLYVTCERKGWAQEALAYNGLVVAWPDIARLATTAPTTPAQGRLI